MKGSSVQGAEGAALLQRDAITPPSLQGLYADSSQRREKSTAFPEQPCTLILTEEGKRTSPLSLGCRERGGHRGCLWHPAIWLSAGSHGHCSAVSYSHKLQPSELQKISISLILIFLAVDFSSSRSRWERAEWGCEVQPISPELSSSKGQLRQKVPKVFTASQESFRPAIKNVPLCRLESWPAITLANSRACAWDGGKRPNILFYSYLKIQIICLMPLMIFSSYPWGTR